MDARSRDDFSKSVRLGMDYVLRLVTTTTMQCETTLSKAVEQKKSESETKTKA